MVSLQERKRRYEALRKSIEEAGYEILVIAAQAMDVGRGFLRYVSDWHLWAGQGYVVFPIDRDPVMVLGARSQTFFAREVGWIKDIRHNLEPIVEVKEILEGWGVRKGIVGVAGLEQRMPVKDYIYLTQQFPEVEFQEAKEVIERVRMIKSAEEIAQIEEASVAVAAALRRFGEVIAPGKTEREIVAAAVEVVHERGCHVGIAHISNGIGPSMNEPSDRVIAYDDVIKFSMEFAGPSGYWMEGSCIWSFREPPPRMLAQYETFLKAFRKGAAMLKPGAVGGEIVAAIEETLREDGGSPTERWLWDLHGIGLDVFEEPVILPGDKRVLQEGMVLCLHPGLLIGEEKFGVNMQDSFLVTPSGGRSLSRIVHQWNIAG